MRKQMGEYISTFHYFLQTYVVVYITFLRGVVRWKDRCRMPPNHIINHNFTGQGQSWPCWLWCQISQKPLIYFTLPITYSCRKVLQIFFNFTQNVKLMFWFIFLWIYIKKINLAVAPPCHPPPRWVLPYIQTTWRWENCQRNVMGNPSRDQSTFPSPSSPVQNRVQHAPDPQLDLLSSSF